MKCKILLAVLLLCGLFAVGQSNYLYRPVRERTISGKADSTFHVPAGLAPSLRTGGWPGSGAMFVDTVGGGRGLWFYALGAWYHVLDSATVAGMIGGGGGSTNTSVGGGYKIAINSTNNVKSLKEKYGITLDSATSNEVGVKLDSATAFPAVRSTVFNNPIGGNFKIAVSNTRDIKGLKAGTNVSLDSTTTSGAVIINAAGDTTEANILDFGAIANDGLSDTAAIKAAQATGKNIFIPPVGEFLWDGYRCTLNKGQNVRGGGLNSKIRFTKDTCDVFYMPNDSSVIERVSFVGKGIGSYPGAETFTFSNAIRNAGNSNTIKNCYFKNVKGACITSWAGSTIYDLGVYNCSGDSNTIGVYLVLNSEYGKFQNLSFQHGKSGFVERCSGNNKWDMLNGDYCDYPFRLASPGGCNGDHGSVSNSTFNHSTGSGITIDNTLNGYVFTNIKTYFTPWNIGTTDTARQVVFRDVELAGTTITTTKAKNCVWTGGSFQPNNSPTVTISGTTGIEFCSIMNSIYQNTTCGVSGGGNVSKVGTPVNNQIGVWTGDGTIEGDANLTWNGSSLGVTGTGTISTSLTTPLLIGGTGTTSDLVLQSTSGVGATGSEMIFKGGNNGGTTFMTISNAGEIGIGTAPVANFKLFLVSGSTSSSNVNALFRNSGSQNLLQIADNGDIKIGNQSVTTSSNWLLNRNWVGPSLTTPTSWLTFAAGTASAQTAPAKFIPGTLLSTIESGTKEYNNAHYETNNALNRYAIGGYIKDFYTDAGNTTTTETDLYSYTTKANTLAADGEKLVVEFSGYFVASPTANRVLRIYFAGSQIASTGTIVDNSGNNAWKATVTIIRTSSTTSRAYTQFTYNNGTSETTLSGVPVQTSLTLSGTNIIKITGQAGGTGAATNDIVATIGTIRWFGAANN